MNTYVDYDIITEDNIRKIRKHRYFHKYRKFNNIMHSYIKFCMYTSMRYNKHREVLILVDYIHNEYLINYGNYEEVALTNRMLYALMTSKHSCYCVIHNHPNEYTFSKKDISTFIRHRINIMVVCTNTCKYDAVIFKTRNISVHELKLIFQMINTFDSTYEIISKLKNFGIIYIEFNNY